MIKTILLDEILKGTVYEEVEQIVKVDIDADGLEVMFWTDEEYFNSINIYELASLCKLWAFRQKIDNRKIDITSSTSHGITSGSMIFQCSIIWGYSNDEKKSFEGESESDAIFKACEYILEQNQ